MSTYRLSAPVLALAAFALVPVAKISLLFCEYKLNLPLGNWGEGFVLALAGGLALTWAFLSAKTKKDRATRVLCVLLFASIGYFIVLFVPGCVWAPACL